MQAIAKAKYMRTSPRKARLVMDAIRGKEVREALGILQFTPNKAARFIEKVLKSAIANAENNHSMDGENLKVSLGLVDGGPIMKRLRYAPMGRGYRIAKRTAHITVGVAEMEEPVDEPKKKTTAKKATKAPAKPAKPATEEATAEASEDTKVEEKPKKKAAPKKKATAAKKADKADTSEKETKAKKTTSTRSKAKKEESSTKTTSKAKTETKKQDDAGAGEDESKGGK